MGSDCSTLTRRSVLNGVSGAVVAGAVLVLAEDDDDQSESETSDSEEETGDGDETADSDDVVFESGVPGVEEGYDCDETTTVDTGQADGETSSSSGVPVAWRDHVEYVREVRDEFREAYSSADWYQATGLRGTGQVCDRRQRKIVVYAYDQTAAREELGDTYRGVQLYIREESNDAPDIGDPDDTDDNPFLGEDTDWSANESTEDENPEDDDLFGFGPLAAVAGIGLTSYLLSRRRETTDEP